MFVLHFLFFCVSIILIISSLFYSFNTFLSDLMFALGTGLITSIILSYFILLNSTLSLENEIRKQQKLLYSDFGDLAADLYGNLSIVLDLSIMPNKQANIKGFFDFISKNDCYDLVMQIRDFIIHSISYEEIPDFIKLLREPIFPLVAYLENILHNKFQLIINKIISNVEIEQLEFINEILDTIDLDVHLKSDYIILSNILDCYVQLFEYIEKCK